MKLNKILALSAVLLGGLSLASCNEPADSTPSTPADSTPAVEEKVSVGLGYTYSYSYTAANAEKGTAAYGQVDFTTAFVAFNEDGTIADARIDVVQIKAQATEEGFQATSACKLDAAGSIRSKLELGTEYNMVAFGGAVQEVDAQMEDFADWTVGQTVAELKANVSAEHGYGVAPHADLEGSVTIVCHDFVAAIEKAYENRTTETFDKAGEAGIAMVSKVNNNYGTWELTTAVAGVMADEGTVVAAQIDELVLQIAVAENGEIAPIAGQKYLDADSNLISKNDLGSAYAMAPASPINAEWDAQAEAIEEAVLGLTTTEIEALVAGQGDLEGTCTMYIGGYVSALSKATTYAALEHVGPQAE